MDKAGGFAAAVGFVGVVVYPEGINLPYCFVTLLLCDRCDSVTSACSEKAYTI